MVNMTTTTTPKVRLWHVEHRGTKTVHVRTVGGTKAEAKKAARRASFMMAGAWASMNPGTHETNPEWSWVATTEFQTVHVND